MPKETQTTTQKQILFDKYEVLRPLGIGSYSSVYLVRHLSLDQERAMKIYPKDNAQPSATLTEAGILKSLRHPGIPLIYDVENDAHSYYVIEEYIHGESLDQFLLHQSFISNTFFYMLCLQLCDIFAYLHSLSPSPIVYRDLKPEHMILCGLQIKLIDFNIATALAPNNNTDHLGNAAFSAPESFSEGTITPVSDLYSIGKIMCYLSSHLEKPPSHNLQKIIQRATEPEPHLRYETVEDLILALTEEQKHTAQTHPVKTIAITGSHRGCGVTHLAISLVSMLNFQGIPAFYYEKNESNSLQSGAEYLKGMVENEGSFHYRFFHGIPGYGNGINFSSKHPGIKVLDYGVLTDQTISAYFAEEADLMLYLTTGAPWERRNVLLHHQKLMQLEIPCIYLCNLCSISEAYELSHDLSVPFYQYPIEPDPFGIQPARLRFFRKLIKRILKKH